MNASPNNKDNTVDRVKLLINGEWVESQSTEWHDIINPATQHVLAQVPFATTGEVDAAVAAAQKAFQTASYADWCADAHHAQVAGVDS